MDDDKQSVGVYGVPRVQPYLVSGERVAMSALIAIQPEPRLPAPHEGLRRKAFRVALGRLTVISLTQAGSKAQEPDSQVAVDRAEAIQLIDKLQALAADRAATEAERAQARAKADALSARFRPGTPVHGTLSTGEEPKGNLQHHWQRGGLRISVGIGLTTGALSRALSSPPSVVDAERSAPPGQPTPS
jgi:hypothetical protein